MGWFLGAVGQTVLGNIMGGRSAKRQNQQLDAWYQQAIQETPAEKEYREKLEKGKKFGDPDLEQKRQGVYRPIFSYGKEAKADATGVSIRQGLENSIIASEIKNKIDAKTYQMINEQADKILAYNTQYKKDAEDKLLGYKLKRDERLRNLAMQYQQGRVSSPDIMDDLMGMGQTMLGSYVSANLPWNQPAPQPNININIPLYPGQEESG